MRFRIFIAIFLIASVSLLTACHKNNSADQDVKRFVKHVEATSQIKKQENDYSASFAAVTYEGANERDPFELPSMVKSNKQYANTILKHMTLDSLKLVGVMMHSDRHWAIFRANDGKLYKMTEGMRVGLQNALLKQIENNQVIFLEELEMGTELKPHEVVMAVSESKP